MFKFVKKDSENGKITEEDIINLEKKFNIKFPKKLREYYLKHNRAVIEECELSISKGTYEIECYVTQIFTLNFGNYNFEYIFNWIQHNKNIPNEFVPLAEDEADDIFCWDSRNEKVYYVRKDEENPIEICENIEAFFEILNICAETKETYNLGPCTVLEYNNEKITNNIDIENVLKFNKKHIIPTLVSFSFAVLSLILYPFLDELTFMLTAVILIFTIIFLGIFITYNIKSKNAVKKYGIDELKKELQQKNTIKVDGANTYLTENYIISNHRRIVIAKYSDIVWTYSKRIFGTWGAISQMAVGLESIAWLKDGKKVTLFISKDTTDEIKIYNKIAQKNKKVMIGYTNENIKIYKNNFPGYNRNNWIATILLIIAILIRMLLK